MQFTSEQELLDFTQHIVGKTFSELDKLHLLNKTAEKGALEKIVETGFFGYALNNDIEADFNTLGIELKVSGFEINTNGTIREKERISLSMID